MTKAQDRGSDVCTRREFIARGALASAALTACGPAKRPTGASVGLPRERPAAPLAMWALTGALDPDLMRRQLDAYHGAGWGVVLYPRSGLEIEYLGGEWFERIRFIVQQAAERGVEVWLYDEFNWPSGHARGLVTRDRPDLAARILRVAANGATQIEPVPESANLLSRAATERFLEVTHGRYAAAIGEWFGSTVRAVFTDEPSLARQHRGVPKGAPGWEVVWSDAMDQALGGDFPARLAKAADPADPALWAPYWAAFARVFEEAWVAPIAEWCRAHRVALSGHLLGEHGFGSQIKFNGSLRRQLSRFGIPGIDEIHTRADAGECEALTLAAIAEFPGRERMAELFAVGPPSMTMETMCRMVDLCAACGVDRYVLAICPLDLRGGVLKREYLGVSGVQQPWFREHARAFTAHAAEAAARARSAQPLGIPWPDDEALWAAAGPDPARSEPLATLTRKTVDAARQAIRSRLEPGPRSPSATPRPIEAEWAFRALTPNTLRIDGADLDVRDMPDDVVLWVQAQLVRGARLNDTPLDIAASPPARAFDDSYRAIPVGHLLRMGRNTLACDSAEPAPLRFLPAIILSGGFAVDAAGRLVAPPARIAPGDWRQRGYPSFSGTGQYRAATRLEALPARLVVNSGGHPVRVVWNGADLGSRIDAPFAFDLRRVARRGRNEIVIEIASTLGHLVDAGNARPVGLLAAWLED